MVYLLIDGVVALEGSSGAAEYLGKYVSAYIYYGDDGDNKVIYIEASDKRNTEMTVSAEDVDEVDMTSRQITYIIGNKGKGHEAESPILEDKVDVGAGAIIIGNLRIVDGCVIGAGAVVTKSFEEKDSVIVGVPGKKIK